VWLEKYEFIVYAIHAFILPQLLKLSIKLFSMKGWFILADYFGVVLSGITLCVLFGILFKKITPKFYALLTGGRV
jgi:hypothetical protein